MADLNNIVRKMLLEDYGIAQGAIDGILKGGKNYQVIDEDYVRPTMNPRANLPLESHGGAFFYYKTIRDALESALAFGQISEEQLPPRSPQYLSVLVK
ncbi:TPA: hypothetical protein HA239_04780 [Candidatus Woesearchaeota archaeon]|nr:hypothetical protein QT06_C0001G0145 [archaeon GW2011_AR15]MBS3104052.1 hypothetical protein [Candidatus Woesearchaeota archaeon]HIH41700.1 hypothetical protein [Candidatus Woesearchaeota archaeon]